MSGSVAMDKEELVIEILTRVLGRTPDAHGIRLSDRLDELGIDSLRVMQIVAEVEDTLDLDFPDSALTPRTFESVESLVRTVSAL